MKQLPPLNALKAFSIAAEQLSFTRAADLLNVSQGAVSRQVRLLEEHLGVELFQRHHRSLSLTPEGHLLAQELAPAFNRISAVADTLRSQSRPLRIKAAATLTNRWLLPRLHDFESRHAGKVQLATVRTPVNPIEVGFDAALIYCPGPPHTPLPGSELLFEELMMPVCNPLLLDDPEKPLSMEQFLRLPILWNHAEGRDWQQWSAALGISELPEPSLIFDTDTEAMQAAISGHGVCLSNLSFISRELSEGQLVSPIDTPLVATGHYYWVVNPQSLKKSLLEQFHHWLCEQAAASMWITEEEEETVYPAANHRAD